MAAKGPPRGQVTEKEKACLENNRVFLLRELDCSILIPLLRTKGILDDGDEQKIKASAQHSEQNGCLLDILLTRTSKGFQAFLEALDEARYEKAASTLRGTLLDGQQTSMAQAPVADDVSEVEDLRKRLQEANKVIEQLRAENVTMSEKLTLADIAQEKIEELTQKVSILSEEKAELRNALNDVRKELADVKTKSSEQQKQFEASANALLEVVEKRFSKLHTRIEEMESQLSQKNMNVTGKKVPFAKRR